MTESEAEKGGGSNDDDSELDYIHESSSVQRERATRQLVWSWHRRLLTLAGANGDMSREKISERFAELGERMRWVGLMMEKRAVIDAVIDRHKKLDDLKIEELLEFVRTRKASSETQRKKVVGALCSIGLILFTALCTLIAQEVSHGGLITHTTHP